MSSERADEPTTPDNQGKPPGQALAAQREAMGWTVEQVAEQLKLAVRQVVALEAGDYASLPSPAVTRGFVRAYAKLVRIDPAPLVAQIAIDTPADGEVSSAAARRPSPASFSQAKFPSHGRRSSLPLGLIAGAVALLAAAAGAWQFGLLSLGSRAEPEVVAPAVVVPTGAAPDAAAPGAAAAPQEASAAGAAIGSSTDSLQTPSVPLISVPGAATAPAAGQGPVVNVPGTSATGAPPSAVPAPPANPVATQAPAPAAAANALVLNVREDSWIEVRPSKGGAPLISRLVKAGSTETVAVEQPVRVVVGNPGGVSATLRGETVALPPVPGKTLSRINLQ